MLTFLKQYFCENEEEKEGKREKVTTKERERESNDERTREERGREIKTVYE